MATLRELAELVGGSVVGDSEAEVTRVAPLDSAGEGEITFVASAKYLPRLQHSRATAIIVTPGVEQPGRNLLVCRNPYLAFAKVLTLLQGGRPEPRGVLPGATVHPGAILAPEVTVHPGCVIGDRVQVGRGTILYPGVILYEEVVVGADCTLHAGVVVRERCRLGDRVIVQPSAVIGSDGFGYAPDGERYVKIPQVGIVIIEDDVEIGAATCIDRAALGVTRIGRGTKIDNLVQIGHNVEIGEDTILVSQVGIAGSSRIGRHCTFGGQSAVAGHLTVGDHVTIGGRGGVTNDVESNQILSGLPVMPHREWLKAAMTFSKLPQMRKEIQRLKKQLDEFAMKLKEM
ncbi:MAG: UDP-3-O-(3-hydroxymyristoyl)glucosamine N-acyltransferase [Desulfuromonadales bacterium]|nr:UDP-3-O-(3-hydroxymyristoyl)glucosamine N-acyltransferase [Desulfuromonadales bacterium]